MTLTVTLDGQPISQKASNLRTTTVSPGGFSSVTFNLERKLDKSLLEEFTDVLVFDPATGEQVGGGRLLEQGRNDDGTWAVTCLGEGLASLQDQETPYHLIDSSDDKWYQWRRTRKRLSAQAGTTPSGSTEGWLLQCEDGAIDSSDFLTLRYDEVKKCGQTIGGFTYDHVEGSTGFASQTTRGDLYNGGTATSMTAQAWSTSIVNRNFREGINFTGPQDAATVRIQSGASDTVSDNYWAHFRNLCITAQRYDRLGALISGTAYANLYVLLSEAFTDLCVRFAPRLDIENARVDETAYEFDQLTWVDGITPMGALDNMLDLEGAFAWHVWEKNSNGKWATELVELPSEVRYEASTDDGFSAPSPSSEVYNRVWVRWTDRRDHVQMTKVDSVVPSLDDAGITRSTILDLADELGSSAQATRRGTEFLKAHANPPNAGTLTIARPIFDRQTGRWVKPFAIRAGGLIRVRGVQPTPDTLNATSPDGVTVFRIVATTFDNDTGQAVLELDSRSLTQTRALAQLARRRARKR